MQHIPFHTHTRVHTHTSLFHSVRSEEPFGTPFRDPHSGQGPGQPLLPLPTGPVWASCSTAQFEPDGVVSGFSDWDLRGWADGEPRSGDSSCQGGLSVLDFSRSLEPSFFGLMSLTKALAPIQWFFLVRSRFSEGHNQPSLPLQQVTGCPHVGWNFHHQPGKSGHSGGVQNDGALHHHHHHRIWVSGGGT